MLSVSVNHGLPQGLQLTVNRLATLAHPQNRHHPFVVKTPEIDVLLPTTIDDDPVYSDDFDLVAGLTLPVLTLIPPDADGMCREAQAAYFLSQVYDLTSQELIPTHGILISRILTLDQDIQKVFARLLRDSKGQRFCGPISLCLWYASKLHKLNQYLVLMYSLARYSCCIGVSYRRQGTIGVKYANKRR